MAASGIVLVPTEAYVSAGHYGGTQAVEAIQIYLAMVGSDTIIPMQVLRSDTIASVKMRIQAFKGFYTKQQRLVYGGRELTRDDHLIRDIGVSNGGRLHLVLHLSDIVDVTVKTTDGAEYVFRVERNRSVRDLKQRISEKAGGLALDAQQLVLRGQYLEDQRRIDELCLQDDAVAVLLVLQRSSKVRTRIIGKDVELSVSEDFVLPSEKPLSDSLEDLLKDKPKYNIPQRQPSYDAGHKIREIVRSEVKSLHVLEPACGILRYQFPDVLVDILEQVKAGLQGGFSPALASEGTGGVYFLKNSYGVDNVAIFKPCDEEPLAINNPRGFTNIPRVASSEGLKKGTRVGEGAMREVAAYLLDHPMEGRRSTSRKYVTGNACVPPTMMVRCAHDAFRYSEYSWEKKAKLGSLQQFVRAFGSCEDMGCASFQFEEVHKIAVLDLRLANTDRNGGNILVCRDENNDIKLVPIDHGYCFPEKFEDVTFEWIYWPQANLPFSPATLEYIASLNAEEDLALLQRHGWSLRTACKRVFHLSTMLLKKGAAAGLTPFQIGSMMCRETLDNKSPIEEMIEEVERGCMLTEPEFLAAMSDVMDRKLDL